MTSLVKFHALQVKTPGTDRASANVIWPIIFPKDIPSRVKSRLPFPARGKPARSSIGFRSFAWPREIIESRYSTRARARAAKFNSGKCNAGDRLSLKSGRQGDVLLQEGGVAWSRCGRTSEQGCRQLDSRWLSGWSGDAQGRAGSPVVIVLALVAIVAASRALGCHPLHLHSPALRAGVRVRVRA